MRAYNEKHLLKRSATSTTSYTQVAQGSQDYVLRLLTSNAIKVQGLMLET